MSNLSNYKYNMFHKLTLLFLQILDDGNFFFKFNFTTLKKEGKEYIYIYIKSYTPIITNQIIL